MTTEMVKRENAGELYRHSTDVAGVCKAIVVKTACNIAGRKYVKCEGWQAIATAHGCIASARDVAKIDGGIVAIGEIRRMDTGAVIATAEGFVGDDEKTWAGRPEYARRAMAQTRAISRACRSAFAHVVVLMDAGLETTPAEEVPDGGFESAKNVTEPERGTPAPKPASAKTPTAPPAERAPSGKFKTITEKQAKRLWAIGKGALVDGDEIARLLTVRYPYIVEEGKTHITLLAPEDYEAACEWAKSGFQDVPAGEPEPAQPGDGESADVPF